MTHPKFGFSISPGSPLGVAEEAYQAEEMGYDRIGIWDSPVLFREMWVTLAAMAASTHKISIGAWVTNPLSRHPVVTASAAASLEDMAPGRVYVGIGSGGTGVWPLGLKTASLAQLESYVLALKDLTAGRRGNYQGHDVRIDWAQGKQIKVIVAAHGPESLKLAGRVGDGAIVGLGITPEVVRSSLSLIAQGAHEAGRDPQEVEVWFTCFWFVDEEPGVAQEQGSWAATSFAAHFARTSVEGKFVPEAYQDALMKIGKIYDYSTHGHVPESQKREYVEYAQRLGILDYMRRRFVFCGQPEEVEAQIRAAMETGARNFDGAIDAELPEHHQRITKFAQLVLPRFREDSGDYLFRLTM